MSSDGPLSSTGIRQRRKAETAARLIRAARERFREDGYAKTAMEDLCARAGVTRGALYHSFGGKEGLFEAVVRQIDREIGDRLLEVAGDTVDLESFVGACIAYLECALDPEVQQIMFRDGPAVLGQRLRDIDSAGTMEPMRQAIAELMEAGLMAEADPMALAVLINGALVDAALWIAGEPSGEVAFDQAAKTVRVLIEGVARSPS